MQLLSIYLQLLRLPTGPVSRLKQIWLYQLISSLGGFLGQQMKWALSQALFGDGRSSTEHTVAAEKAFLQRAYYQGRVATLLCQRRDYARMVQEIRQLAQQLRSTKEQPISLVNTK